MSAIRAKFQCLVVEEQPDYQQKKVSFVAVTEGSEENKSFAKYTPAGSLELFVSDGTPASEFFEQGKEYYFDITSVD